MIANDAKLAVSQSNDRQLRMMGQIRKEMSLIQADIDLLDADIQAKRQEVDALRAEMRPLRAKLVPYAQMLSAVARGEMLDIVEIMIEATLNAKRDEGR